MDSYEKRKLLYINDNLLTKHQESLTVLLNIPYGYKYKSQQLMKFNLPELSYYKFTIDNDNLYKSYVISELKRHNII
jgi:hypothetical protein